MSTAWIVALNATPYLAVPAYWVFGRSKFQDYISLRREVAASLEETLEQELASLEPFRTSWSADGHQTFRAVEKLARLHFVDGNRVELLAAKSTTWSRVSSSEWRLVWVERYLAACLRRPRPFAFAAAVAAVLS